MGARYKESAPTPAVAFLVKATDRASVYANYIEGLSQGAMAPNTAENAGEVFAPYRTKQKEVGVRKVDVVAAALPDRFSDKVEETFGEDARAAQQIGYANVCRRFRSLSARHSRLHAAPGFPSATRYPGARRIRRSPRRSGAALR